MPAPSKTPDKEVNFEKKKRIVIFFDGTWDTPEQNSNVWRSQAMVASCSRGDKLQQLCYYENGVGTDDKDQFIGGAFGKGLSKNIMSAYIWLMTHYNDGDIIYIFGFSRGAFTARSFFGLLATCGLLRPGSPISIKTLFKRYQLASETNSDDDRKKALYELLDMRDEDPDHQFSEGEEWLLRYSRRIDVEYMGLWDTVAALGLDLGNIEGISASSFKWHNTNLSVRLKNTRHALAIDEHREPFKPTLWEAKAYINPETGAKEKLYVKTKVEQRWFVGCHGNVGGGYDNDRLAQIPLKWILEGAENAGLSFRTEVQLKGDEWTWRIPDSYSDFWGKASFVYKRLPVTQLREHFRPLSPEPWEEKNDDGEVIAINYAYNLCIDKSVFQRYQYDRKDTERKNNPYSPKRLEEWAKSVGVDLNTVQPETLCVLTGKKMESFDQLNLQVYSNKIRKTDKSFVPDESIAKNRTSKGKEDNVRQPLEYDFSAEGSKKPNKFLQTTNPANSQKVM